MQPTLQVSSTPAHLPPGRLSTQQPAYDKQWNRESIRLNHKHDQDLFKYPNIIKQYQTSPCLLCLRTVAKTQVWRGGLARTVTWCACPNINDCGQMMPNASKRKIKRIEIIPWSLRCYRALDALDFFSVLHVGSWVIMWVTSDITRNHQKWPWLAWSLFLASASPNNRPCTQGGQMGQAECTGIGIKPKIKDSKDAKNRAAQHVLGLGISHSAWNTSLDCRWLWCGTSCGCLLTHAQKSGDQSTPKKIQKENISLRVHEVFLGGLWLLRRSFHHFRGPMRQRHQLRMWSNGSYPRPEILPKVLNCVDLCRMLLDVQITSTASCIQPVLMKSDGCSIVP